METKLATIERRGSSQHTNGTHATETGVLGGEILKIRAKNRLLTRSILRLFSETGDTFSRNSVIHRHSPEGATSVDTQSGTSQLNKLQIDGGDSRLLSLFSVSPPKTPVSVAWVPLVCRLLPATRSIVAMFRLLYIFSK
jgi:hypothetical protein